MTEPNVVVEWWPRLSSAWVVLDGERVGWIGKHGDYATAYNAKPRWGEFVGRFPDVEAAVAALCDPRAQDWRRMIELGGRIT